MPANRTLSRTHDIRIQASAPTVCAPSNVTTRCAVPPRVMTYFEYIDRQGALTVLSDDGS